MPGEPHDRIPRASRSHPPPAYGRRGYIYATPTRWRNNAAWSHLLSPGSATIHRWQWFGSCTHSSAGHGSAASPRGRPCTEYQLATRHRNREETHRSTSTDCSRSSWHHPRGFYAISRAYEHKHCPDTRMIVPLPWTKESRNVGQAKPSVETEARKGHAVAPACCMCCPLRLRALPCASPGA